MRIKKIKAKSVKRCTVCGKKFDMWDVQESFRFHHRVGYGSKYDGRDLNPNMCCACFDGLMDELVPRCKTNPLLDPYAKLALNLSIKIWSFIPCAVLEMIKQKP